jgi:predicted enzyme related to lactoylglutathione lyase
MNPVVHFEMPAEDRKRMADFYTKVFLAGKLSSWPKIWEIMFWPLRQIPMKRAQKAGRNKRRLLSKNW